MRRPIADVLVLTVPMFSDNFVEELRKVGLKADRILPEGGGMAPDGPGVVVYGHGRHIVMARAEIEAAATAGTEQRDAASWQPWRHFTDEHWI
ncbi:hypothetical protein [Streptomyces sp. NPDC093094]|uniref:hypothetical protein n=1 Tax=Streptomyces sp. NPDC093094 TaxID=3366026 RepID=UPI0038188BA5